jgi:RNA polymerase subunit RPABC4/transcription elongation factor Spt4
LYKTADQIADRKWTAYEWFGLVIRIDQTKTAKKLFESKPYNAKKVGRAKLR